MDAIIETIPKDGVVKAGMNTDVISSVEFPSFKVVPKGVVCSFISVIMFRKSSVPAYTTAMYPFDTSELAHRNLMTPFDTSE